MVRVTLRPEFQLLRVVADGLRVSLSHGGAPFWQGRMATHAAGIALCATRETAEFSGFSLTLGWEELFAEDGDPDDLGWETLAGSWTVRNGLEPASG